MCKYRIEKTKDFLKIFKDVSNSVGFSKDLFSVITERFHNYQSGELGALDHDQELRRFLLQFVQESFV
jgi:hypothetical protein